MPSCQSRKPVQTLAGKGLEGNWQNHLPRRVGRLRGAVLSLDLPQGLPEGSWAIHLVLLKDQEQKKITLQVVRDQKILFDMLMTVLAEPGGEVRVGKQEANLVRGSVDRMCQHARHFMDDLRWNPTHG